MTAWSHLPNAAHIEAVLADVQARPKVWGAAWDAVRSTAWIIAWGEARSAARSASWDAAWDITRGREWGAVRDAIHALIAWPESAALLDLTPDALRTIISTCDGDVKHQAVLLLPAVIARGTP